MHPRFSIMSGLDEGMVVQRGPQGGRVTLAFVSEGDGPATGFHELPILDLRDGTGAVVPHRAAFSTLATTLPTATPVAAVKAATLLTPVTADTLLTSVRPVRGTGPSLVLELTGLPPGGPWHLSLKHGEVEVRRTFWVGDLWLMAGQSNMEGIGLLEDAAEPHPLVRHFSMARTWSLAREPLHCLEESPDPVHNGGREAPSPEEAEGARAARLKGTGLGLHFARRMAELTGLPQGLIACAQGGTSMSQWSPDLGPGRVPNGSTLYGSVLTSMKQVGQPLAGVLWYQGCSDTNPADAAVYADRMENLVAALREDLGQHDLPWLMVQISRETGRRWDPASWHRIQDAQRQLPARIRRLGVVASADLEQDDWIHISGRAFALLADRMAQLARHLVLGQAGTMPPPAPVRARWAPDAISPAIRLYCEHCEGGLSAPGRPLGFSLADGDLNEVPLVYQVRCEGDSVVVRLTGDDVSHVGLCHGMGAEPLVNTCDGRGMLLPVFGPLWIEGRPASGPWLRTWRVGPPLDPAGFFGPARPGSDGPQWPDQVPTAPGDWPERHFEGWNILSMRDEWRGQDQVRLFRTWVEVDEAMELVLECPGDGPLAAWLDQDRVLADRTVVDGFGPARISGPMRLAAGVHELTIAFHNRGGQAYGCGARLCRRDRTELVPGLPLPRECSRPDS